MTKQELIELKEAYEAWLHADFIPEAWEEDRNYFKEELLYLEFVQLIHNQFPKLLKHIERLEDLTQYDMNENLKLSNALVKIREHIWDSLDENDQNATVASPVCLAELILDRIKRLEKAHEKNMLLLNNYAERLDKFSTALNKCEEQKREWAKLGFNSKMKAEPKLKEEEKEIEDILKGGEE